MPKCLLFVFNSLFFKKYIFYYKYGYSKKVKKAEKYRELAKDVDYPTRLSESSRGSRALILNSFCQVKINYYSLYTCNTVYNE